MVWRSTHRGISSTDGSWIRAISVRPNQLSRVTTGTLISRSGTWSFGIVMLAFQAGCSGPEGTLEVRAVLDGTPQDSLEIAVLSYDAQGILDSLERASPDPRPEFSELDAALRAFRRADPDSIADLHSDWTNTRRTVDRLADSLNQIGRAAPGYADAYARFRSAYRTLAGTEAGLESRMRTELAEDRDLAQRAAAAADSLRTWERTAFRDFSQLTASLEEVVVTTDSAGRARVSLSPGRWWIVGRVSDPDNPFLEFSWNVPVVVSSLVPVVVPVGDHNVSLRWRR